MASRWASGASRCTPCGPSKNAGVPVMTQVQPGEAAGVDLVDELPQRVQRLVADVAADPLQRLDLVEHEQQSRVAGVAQHGQQALQEASAPKWSRSPLTPAARFAAAATCGWPPSQAASPSAVARSRRALSAAR